MEKPFYTSSLLAVGVVGMFGCASQTTEDLSLESQGVTQPIHEYTRSIATWHYSDNTNDDGDEVVCHALENSMYRLIPILRTYGAKADDTVETLADRIWSLVKPVEDALGRPWSKFSFAPGEDGIDTLILGYRDDEDQIGQPLPDYELRFSGDFWKETVLTQLGDELRVVCKPFKTIKQVPMPPYQGITYASGTSDTTLSPGQGAIYEIENVDRLIRVTPVTSKSNDVMPQGLGFLYIEQTTCDNGSNIECDSESGEDDSYTLIRNGRACLYDANEYAFLQVDVKSRCPGIYLSNKQPRAVRFVLYLDENAPESVDIALRFDDDF